MSWWSRSGHISLLYIHMYINIHVTKLKFGSSPTQKPIIKKRVLVEVKARKVSNLGGRWTRFLGPAPQFYLSLTVSIGNKGKEFQ